MKIKFKDIPIGTVFEFWGDYYDGSYLSPTWVKCRKGNDCSVKILAENDIPCSGDAGLCIPLNETFDIEEQ